MPPATYKTISRRTGFQFALKTGGRKDKVPLEQRTTKQIPPVRNGYQTFQTFQHPQSFWQKLEGKGLLLIYRDLILVI